MKTRELVTTRKVKQTVITIPEDATGVRLIYNASTSPLLLEAKLYKEIIIEQEHEETKETEENDK